MRMAKRHKGWVNRKIHENLFKGDSCVSTDRSERTIKHTGSPIEFIDSDPGPLVDLKVSYSEVAAAFPLHAKED